MDRFETELVALGGTFTRCAESELGGRIAALLQERGIAAILAWEAAHLPPGLLDELQKAGIAVCHTPDASVKAGLTGALAGVAETGTLVLPGAPGRPLVASLLPEIHLAVLKESEITLSLPEVIGRQEVREASALALISGPSRTADIEMTLTIGVHGPGEVRVFCV
jgi:L-lactate dehydrogenase complex protein LldG